MDSSCDVIWACDWCCCFYLCAWLIVTSVVALVSSISGLFAAFPGTMSRFGAVEACIGFHQLVFLFLGQFWSSEGVDIHCVSSLRGSASPSVAVVIVSIVLPLDV